MSTAPRIEIDPTAFWADPYPMLAKMRKEAPIAFVPQLGSTLLTRRDDIFVSEKRIDVFSSDQPAGLMTRLMGHNMLAVGWKENLLQIAIQGILSGPLATYLSAYAASVLGAGRGATFSALVPGFTVLVGVLALGEWPTLIQLCGLVVVAVGFRLVMMR